MCGIIGALGEQDVVPVLLEGLRRLEYRGYDSAGLAVIDPLAGRFQRVRTSGKVARLVNMLEAQPLQGCARHRPHALGDPRQALGAQCASTCL